MKWRSLVGVFVVLAVLRGCSGLNNGVARTPPMGWLSWERYACITDCDTYPDQCISANLYQRMADALVSQGYAKVGYQYVNIDDCWPALERDSQGNLQADPIRFPGGIKAVADYVHAKGLKLGLYLDIGSKTCAGYPGFDVPTSTSYEQDVASHQQYLKDVQLMASWGIDSLKVDGCYAEAATMNITYPKLSMALNATGRPILYSCSWPDYVRISLGDQAVQFDLLVRYCNMWRNFDDIQDSFDSITTIAQYWRTANSSVDSMNPFAVQQNPLYKSFLLAAGPGSWNDPDMILVGGTGLSLAQSRIQLSLWSILAAPLLMSNDLYAMEPGTVSLLQNKEMIAINQDPMGAQGFCVSQCGAGSQQQVWARKLANGDVAVAFVNFSSFGPAVNIAVAANSIFLASGQTFIARDVFAGRNLGQFKGSITVQLTTSNAILLRLHPVSSSFP
ncbi:Alpha-galactosidase A [Balamuthia mandrillaris]